MRQLSDGFWNLRGKFKIAGVIDIGTQMSVARRANGRFIILDSYSADGADREQLLSLTDGGRKVDAIINVHPFHTLHCRAFHGLFPEARLIGTRRHRDKLPDLPWEQGVIEDAAVQAEFEEDFAFSVPRGVDFICPDESVHVASVLVRHRASGIVHVDDTINVFQPPRLLRAILPQPKLRFHPMLAKALQNRPGAADEYAAWARLLAEEWSDTRIVCAAHSAIRTLPQGGWRAELLSALDAVEKTLKAHRAAHR
ncbi:hypothetical protein [Novosphingobium sp. M1R2S20]|uniref:Metallo-beta-lactamase superfamily protein n=1 Tax=Novosphingobium rhizovicinum TaxID=3228928 RepID=A0ABV3REG2_9SPHN